MEMVGETFSNIWREMLLERVSAFIPMDMEMGANINIGELFVNMGFFIVIV